MNVDDTVPSVDAAAAIAQVAGGALMLDVREQSEWDDGHSPDAVLIPLGELADRVGELDQDRRLVVVCHSGARSARATSFLRDAGRDAVNVSGGMVAWRAANGPLSAN